MAPSNIAFLSVLNGRMASAAGCGTSRNVKLGSRRHHDKDGTPTIFVRSAEKRVVDDVDPATVGLTPEDLGGHGDDRVAVRRGFGQGRGVGYQGEVIDSAGCARFELQACAAVDELLQCLANRRRADEVGTGGGYKMRAGFVERHQAVEVAWLEVLHEQGRNLLRCFGAPPSACADWFVAPAGK